MARQRGPRVVTKHAAEIISLFLLRKFGKRYRPAIVLCRARVWVVRKGVAQFSRERKSASPDRFAVQAKGLNFAEAGDKDSLEAGLLPLDPWGGIGVQDSGRGALGMTERRLARRYDLALPVIVQLPINKEATPHNGQTRDISTRGVYFILHKELQPGTELDFTLTLPAEITQGTEVFVRAHGRVVRVDRKGEAESAAAANVGVAAVIERYDIIRGEPVRA